MTIFVHACCEVCRKQRTCTLVGVTVAPKVHPLRCTVCDKVTLHTLAETPYAVHP